jgi:hypothetical protein
MGGANHTLDHDADNLLVDAPSPQDISAPDSEEARCRSMYAAAIAAHFTAILQPSAADEFERAASMRILTSMAPAWRQDREFLCDAAGFDGDEVRQRAIALLADADERARCVKALRTGHGHEHANTRRNIRVNATPALAAE